MKSSSLRAERTKNSIVQLNQDIQKLIVRNANRVKNEVGINVSQSIIFLGAGFFGTPLASSNYADLTIYFMIEDIVPKEWPCVAVADGKFIIRQGMAKTPLAIEQLQKLVKIYFNAVAETE